MAEEPIQIQEQTPTPERKKPSMALVLLIIAGASLGFMYQLGLFDTAPISNENAGYDPDVEKKKQEAEKKAQSEFELGITGPSEAGGQLAILDRRLNTQQEQLNRERLDSANYRRETQAQAQAANKKMQEMQQSILELSQLIQAQSYDRSYDNFKPDGEELPVLPTEAPTPSFDYKTYSRAISAPTGKQSTNAQGTTLADDLAAKADNAIDKTFELSGATEVGGTGATRQISSSETTILGQSGNRETIGLDVPAGSFAQITNLHGVDCPIGGSSAVSQQDDLFSNTPVTLQVRSIFKGPLRAQIDFKNAHLIGVCVGLRNTKRARIKIERFSYYDEYGKQQFIPINGYVNDGDDHSQDVSGTLISTPAKDVALLALSDFIAAVGSFTSQTESSTVTSAITGTATTDFTGDKARALFGAGIQNSANRTSQILAQQVAASIDVIHIDAGRKMEMFISGPFTVQVDAHEVPLDDEINI